MKLTMAVYGFFVYPMSGDRCLGLIAPKVDATAPHRCDLLIRGNLRTPHPSGLTPYLNRGSGVTNAWTLPLNDARLELGSGKPADARGFDLIQRMDSIICGLRLPENYQESEAVHVGVTLAGGTITAHPDTFTARGEWSWESCDGQTVTTRLTSYTVYETEGFSGTVTLRPRAGEPVAFSFDGEDVMLALRYGLAGKSLIAAVNASHVDASKRLCNDPHAEPRQAKERRVPVALAAWTGIDGTTVDFLNGLDKPQPAKYAFEGDPHCSARMIQVDGAGQTPVQQAGA